MLLCYLSDLRSQQVLSILTNYHLQRRSAASSTPLLRGTSSPSAAPSSGPACPEPTEDFTNKIIKYYFNILIVMSVIKTLFQASG